MSSNSNPPRRFTITRLEERIAPCSCQSLNLFATTTLNPGCLPPLNVTAAVQTNPLHAGLVANVGGLLHAQGDP
jgi:hypothetical protein